MAPSCHSIHFVLVTLSRSEGSLALGVELLRGVDTERSACAQHDRTALSDRAVLLPRHRHLRAFRLLSHLQHLMAFS
jgi:hypothetical protein